MVKQGKIIVLDGLDGCGKSHFLKIFLLCRTHALCFLRKTVAG